MKLFMYPASHKQNELSDQLLALKIARHSACTSCETCSGVHPDASWEIILDNSSAEIELDQYDSDDEDGHPSYLKFCACGHDMYDHGANQPLLGCDEFV